MVKKKKMDSQEKILKDQYKTTENKDINLSPESPDSDHTDTTVKESPADTDTEGGVSDTAETDTEKNDLMQVQAKLAEMQDKYIRLSAEFDNYRKRTLREKMELSKYGGENILHSILPLMDDFDRAIKHLETATDCGAMKNGIDLIYGKFSEFLKQNGIKEIESLDSNFNVDLHEAVAKTPVEADEKKGKVVDVILKGYYLQDKVLRYSKVVVGE